MTIEYQQNLLSFLVQYPEGITYINDLDEKIFDLLEFQLSLQILKKYYKLYGTLPSKTTAQQFLEEQIAETKNISPEIVQDLRDVMEDIYYPLPQSDKQKLQDTLILEIQERNIENTFMDFAAHKLSVNQVFTKINKYSSLVKSVGYEAHKDGGFLVGDRDRHFDEQVEGHPTFLHDLNMLTAARGFFFTTVNYIYVSTKTF